MEASVNKFMMTCERAHCKRAQVSPSPKLELYSQKMSSTCFFLTRARWCFVADHLEQHLRDSSSTSSSISSFFTNTPALIGIIVSNNAHSAKAKCNNWKVTRENARNAFWYSSIQKENV